MYLSPWLFNIFMDAVMKEVNMMDGKEESEVAGGWEIVEITWSLACG